MPAPAPVTTPVADTVAIVGVLLLHVPPAVASLNPPVDPTHTAVAPVMAGIAAPTVTASPTEHAPDV